MGTTKGCKMFWSEKLLPVPGLLLTTFLATGLFASKFDHWASSRGFAVIVDNNRSTVGLVVQVISHVLGMLHVYALSQSACPPWRHKYLLCVWNLTCPVQQRSSIYPVVHICPRALSLWISSNAFPLSLHITLIILYHGSTPFL